jgi:HAD superfamily hydrolase (TIGR01509 family)
MRPLPRRVRALVFDFDGLILETETPVFESWQEVYREHGYELPREIWDEIIGGGHVFDPRAHLEERIGRPLEAAVVERRAARRTEMVEALDVLPGVIEYVLAATELGLKLGVASSSSRRWVTGHLERLGLTQFECIRCADDVEHAKPAPDLYLAVCDCLGVAPETAIAFEDSANGIAAAKAAGLRCVAVPNAMTAGLDLSAADLRLDSLAAMPLAELLKKL